jgi:putative phage-type endonuclease
MIKILTSTEGMSNSEWLQWRNLGIGGSDASVVCGINQYKSTFELWMEKTGQVEAKQAGEPAYWGTLLEPIVRSEFEQRTGLLVNQEHSILQHPKHKFMLANVDGVVIDPVKGKCIFEAKTANQYKLGQWESGVPEEYLLQVQHYMAVTSFEGAYVAALVGGNKFLWHFIKRDNELIDMLIQLEDRFWQYVTTNTPPPFDGSAACSELLNRLYSSSTSKSCINLPDEAMGLIQQYEDAAEEEKRIAELKDEATNKLKSILQDNEVGIVADRTVSWKTISSDRFDSKSLKSEMPDIYAKYITNSSYRRFTIKS